MCVHMWVYEICFYLDYLLTYHWHFLWKSLIFTLWVLVKSAHILSFRFPLGPLNTSLPNFMFSIPSHNSLSPHFGAHVWMDVGSPTGAWTPYQCLPALKKSSLLPLAIHQLPIAPQLGKHWGTLPYPNWKFYLAFFLGPVQRSTAAMSSTSHDLSRGQNITVLPLLLWCLHSSCPFFLDVLWGLGGCYKCSVYGWEPTITYSQPFEQLHLCISHYPLQ